MAKEAGIKITLKSSGFTSGLKDVENQTKAAGKSMGSSLQSALSGGLKGGLSALKGSLSTIKSTVLSIGSIGGAIGGVAGTVALVQGAMKAEGGYKKLAFAMRAGTGEAVNFRDLQKAVQTEAIRTGIAAEDLTGVMSHVFGETGSKDFATKSLGTIATVARATKEPVETLGSIAGTLGKQFGVASADIGEGLTEAFVMANKGEITLDEMAERLNIIGANAKEAGFTGTAGFRQMMGLMNQAHDGLGNLRRGIPAVSGLLDKLSTKSERNKILMKAGVDPSSFKGGAMDALRKVMEKTGGSRDKLKVAGFADAELQMLSGLGTTYAKTFADTKGSVKQRTDAALVAYDEAMRKAGTASMNYADVEAQAAANLKGAQAQMDQAMEKLKESVSKPEFIKGLTTLMERLPGAVDKIVKLVDFAAENPYTASMGGAAAVAGKGALGVGADATAVIVANYIKAAFGIGGAAAAKQVVVAGASSAAALADAAPAAGGALAVAFGTVASGAAALAIGAAIGYAVGKAIKEYWNRKAKERDDELADSPDADGTKHKEGGKALIWKRDEKGVMHAQEVSGEEADNWAAKNHNAGAELYASGKLGGGWKAPMALPGGAFNFAADNGGTDAGGRAARPGGPAPAPAQNAALNARLIADMLGSKELKVRITNPEAIGGPGGASGPTPGNVPRS